MNHFFITLALRIHLYIPRFLMRAQIRMTIAAYQTLYESSIAYGMRKALAAEQAKSQMQAKVRLSLDT